MAIERCLTDTRDLDAKLVINTDSKQSILSICKIMIAKYPKITSNKDILEKIKELMIEKK